MTKEEYTMIQDFIISQASMLERLDLDGFIEWASYSDSVGAILDPWLYRKGHRKLSAIKDLAIEAKGFVGAFRKLNELTKKEDCP